MYCFKPRFVIVKVGYKIYIIYVFLIMINENNLIRKIVKFQKKYATIIISL